MYSPKVEERFIPELYRLAKKRKRPMTKVMNGLLGFALSLALESEKEKCPDNDHCGFTLPNRDQICLDCGVML